MGTNRTDISIFAKSRCQGQEEHAAVKEPRLQPVMHLRLGITQSMPDYRTIAFFASQSLYQQGNENPDNLMRWLSGPLEQKNHEANTLDKSAVMHMPLRYVCIYVV